MLSKHPDVYKRQSKNCSKKKRANATMTRMNTRFERTEKAVSYTHLPFIKGKNLQAIKDMLAEKGLPVSYTHLDVYKRQVLCDSRCGSYSRCHQRLYCHECVRNGCMINSSLARRPRHTDRQSEQSASRCFVPESLRPFHQREVGYQVLRSIHG